MQACSPTNQPIPDPSIEHPCHASDCSQFCFALPNTSTSSEAQPLIKRCGCRQGNLFLFIWTRNLHHNALPNNVPNNFLFVIICANARTYLHISVYIYIHTFLHKKNRENARAAACMQVHKQACLCKHTCTHAARYIGLKPSQKPRPGCIRYLVL